MDVRIETYDPGHLNAVIDLSLRAWAPVFDSLQKVLNADVYQAFYSDSWRVSQQKLVARVCAAKDISVWVAVEAETPVGFVALKLDAESSLGEIYMVAVDPDYQGQGIGTNLTKFALDQMKEAGMSVAMVDTGGDPGHGPARHTYEKAGFELFPSARYFKKL